jgi:hypothetical protein
MPPDRFSTTATDSEYRCARGRRTVKHAVGIRHHDWNIGRDRPKAWDVLMRRRCPSWLLHFYGANAASLLPAFGTPQTLLEVRDPRIPAAQMRQQVWIRTPLVIAATALDDQKILTELIGQPQHIEVSSHARYCTDIQAPISSIFSVTSPPKRTH